MSSNDRPTDNDQQPADGSSHGHEGSEATPVAPPLLRTRAFRVLLENAAILGIALAFLALVFLGLVKEGGQVWYNQDDVDWFGGELWWVGVTAGTGVLVGVLRRLLRMAPYEPGLIEEVQSEHVEPASVPKIVAVSAVSLVGGASLGPEQALGSMGGGSGGWLSRRRGADEDGQKTTLLTGFSSAYSGLLSSPLLSTMLVVELARPAGGRYFPALIGGLFASVIAFAIYVVIAGEPFLKAFETPAYEYKDWHLLAGVIFGLVGAAIALVLAVTMGVMRRVAAPLEPHPILRCTLGGIIYGLIGVALPLTLFTGNDQLPTLIEDGAELGTVLVVAILVGKIVAFSLCQTTGFIGGPFLPSMFIGGTAGVAANLLLPDLPLGLAFACLLVAVPGAMVGIPFTLVLLAVLTTGAGALQSAPIAVAAVTSYLAVSGSGVLSLLAHRAASGSARPSQAPAAH